MAKRSYEMRCPSDTRRLFGKIVVDEHEDSACASLLEFSCRDCKKALQRKGDMTVQRVFHYFDVYGRLAKTDVVRNEYRGEGQANDRCDRQADTEC